MNAYQAIVVFVLFSQISTTFLLFCCPYRLKLQNRGKWVLYSYFLVFGSCNSKFCQFLFQCLFPCPSVAGMVLKYSLLLRLLLLYFCYHPWVMSYRGPVWCVATMGSEKFTTTADYRRRFFYFPFRKGLY